MNYDRLKQLAKQKGISLKKLAVGIGMTEAGFFSSIKEKTLRVDKLELCAKELGIPVTAFFEDQNENTNIYANIPPQLEGIDHHKINEMKMQDNEKVELLMMLCDQYQFKIYALQKELQVKDNLLKITKGTNQPG